MTDLDRNVEKLNQQEGIIAYVRRAPGIAVLVGLFVLAGMLHIFTALGLLTGATQAGNVLAAFPGLEAIVSTTALARFAVTLGVVIAVVGILDLVVAWAVWDLRSWAWGTALALSILELFVIPWGLILGVLRIVYLSMRDVRATYDEDARGLRATIRARRA